MALTPAQMACYGLNEDHLIARDALPLGIRHPVHHDTVEPFLELQRAAAQGGFDLQIVSGFRSFERQLTIWSDKVAGRRVVLDALGHPLDLQSMADRDKVLAIMRWSALPGCSRHHWGSDIDVFDAAAVAPDYVVQLVPQEVECGGVFAPLHDWLDGHIRANPGGFFRPYDRDRGAIAPERWHLSFAPVAVRFEQTFCFDTLVEIWFQQQLPLLASVLALPRNLLQRYLPLS